MSSCSDKRLRRSRDFSVRIPTLKLPFRFRAQYSVSPSKVDGFRVPSAAFARVSLREPSKLDQFGLGRHKSGAELS
jgi:hypothetical protein